MRQSPFTQTYTVATPLATHWRRASCAEVECGPYRNGFQVRVDEATPLGQEQAAYIRAGCARAHTERREAGLTVFSFPPGQMCFLPHEVPLEREPLFLVRRGMRQPQVHRRGEDWIDDMQTHLDRLRG